MNKDIEAISNACNKLCSHYSITRDSPQMTHASDGDWYYQQIELGFNYRMTELQAALGASQMVRLYNYVIRRHHLARRYDKLLGALAVTIPWQHPDGYSGLHLYVIRLQLGKISWSHREAFDSLRKLGIGCNLHYIPVHTQPYYQLMGFKAGDFPEAESYYTDAISLPIYSSLTEEQQDHVITALRSIFLSQLT